MNLVVISTIVGVKPTMDTLKEGQLGVNTADGRMYVNTGTRIKTMGSQHWKRNIPYTQVVTTVSSPTFITLLDVTGSEVLTHHIAMTTMQATPAVTAEMRITIDGEVKPIMTLTGLTDKSVTKIFVGSNGAIQDEPEYAESSLKIEMRKLTGTPDPSCHIVYTTGEYI